MDRTKPRLSQKLKIFSTKQIARGQRKRRSPMQLLTLRLHDLSKLFYARYGKPELTDNEHGREDLWIMLNHLACLPHPQRAVMAGIEKWAPWMTMAEANEMGSRAMFRPSRYKADDLAWKLKLNKLDRRTLGITTIGAIDEGKAARTKRRRQLDRQRKENERRAKGAKARKVYEQQSAERHRPWELEGISRRTWYRRRGTSAATP